MFSFPLIILRHWSYAWILNFFISLFFLISLLLIFTISEDLHKYLNLFESNPFGFIKIVFIPFLPWLLPVSCFTGTILTLCVFEKHLEWSTIRACSISPYSIICSFLFLSTIVSLSQYILTSFLFQDSDYTLNKNKTGFIMKVGKKSTWYFQSFNAENSEGKNLQVYLCDAKGNDAFRLRCERAVWDEANGWDFYNGVYLSFDTNDGLPIPNIKHQRLDWIMDKENIFSDQDAGKTPLRKLRFENLRLKELNANPYTYLLLGERPENLSFKRLKKVLTQFSDSENRVIASMRFRFAQICIGFFSSLFATFFAVLLVSDKERFSFSAIFAKMLVAMIVFYLVANLSNPLGQIGFFNEWFAVIIPYLSAFLLLFFSSKYTDLFSGLRL